MTLTDAEKVADYLQGTCKSLHDALEELDMEGRDNDMAFCADLDDRVFCCSTCDWWCEVSEAGEDTQGGHGIECVDCGNE